MAEAAADSRAWPWRHACDGDLCLHENKRINSPRKIQGQCIDKNQSAWESPDTPDAHGTGPTVLRCSNPHPCAWMAGLDQHRCCVCVVHDHRLHWWHAAGPWHRTSWRVRDWTLLVSVHCAHHHGRGSLHQRHAHQRPRNGAVCLFPAPIRPPHPAPLRAVQPAFAAAPLSASAQAVTSSLAGTSTNRSWPKQRALARARNPKHP